jgi:hypothetical protein
LWYCYHEGATTFTPITTAQGIDDRFRGDSSYWQETWGWKFAAQPITCTFHTNQLIDNREMDGELPTTGVHE